MKIFPAIVSIGFARIASASAVRLLLLISLVVVAGLTNAEQGNTPQTSSAEFTRMKTLVGTWKGKADMGQGLTEFTVEYRLVAGGNALEERIFVGTPKEMVTMYHDQHGKLALTHYCMLGNRPGMVLQSSNDKTLKFDFDETCGLDAKTEMHMHSLWITFDDADTITQSWRLFAEGKPKDEHPFTLRRVKG